jgi:parvulin-like peptidyl-prolyl cis-trans isomerase-like protein
MDICPGNRNIRCTMESASLRESPGNPWFVPLCLGLLVGNVLLALAVWNVARRHLKPEPPDETGLPAIVAKVNGRPITRSELVAATQLAPSVEVGDELFKKTLRNLIASKAVASTASPVARTDNLNELTEHQFSTRDDFNRALTGADLVPSDLAKRLDIWQTALSALNPSVPEPTDAQLRAFYGQHRAAFTLPEAVEATQFASIFSPRSSAEDRAATQARFEDAQEKFQHGMSFADLIEMLSDDPAKKATHGTLSWFQRTRMTAPEIPEVAFRTAIGQISALIQTRYGFHLLQITGHNPARELTFEEARPELVTRVTDQLRREKIKEMVEQAVAKSRVEILTDRLK